MGTLQKGERAVVVNLGEEVDWLPEGGGSGPRVLGSLVVVEGEGPGGTIAVAEYFFGSPDEGRIICYHIVCNPGELMLFGEWMRKKGPYAQKTAERLVKLNSRIH